jgi:alkanesulfonate monooxygenase SsuD/methylene tetrahydromethanopterin reductase-like flavin-dependent oxidoreductase (luciferase family)
MKLGYFTMPVHPPARSYVETLKEDREAFILADRLGYSEGYCGEHLTDLAENIPNSMMFIAALLGVTSRMKLGTAVVNLPHSHPVVVASNAAMLDPARGPVHLRDRRRCAAHRRRGARAARC